MKISRTQLNEMVNKEVNRQLNEAPEWVTQRKIENTEKVKEFVNKAMNGKINSNGNTTLQKLKDIKFRIINIVPVAKQSNIDKQLFSKFISKFKLLAATPIKKENLDKLDSYIKLFKL